MIPASKMPGWERLVALEVNPLLQGYPFQSLTAAPASVLAGFTYYDVTLGKVRTWDGAVWNNHY